MLVVANRIALVTIRPTAGEIFRRDGTERGMSRRFNRNDVPLAGIKYCTRLKSRRGIVNVSPRRIRLCTYSLRAGRLAKRNEQEKTDGKERERERENGGARKGEQSRCIACVARMSRARRLDGRQSTDRTYYVIVHMSRRTHSRQNRGCEFLGAR